MFGAVQPLFFDAAGEAAVAQKRGGGIAVKRIHAEDVVQWTPTCARAKIFCSSAQRYVDASPSRSVCRGFQSRANMRELSSILRGGPSGFEESNLMAPS